MIKFNDSSHSLKICIKVVPNPVVGTNSEVFGWFGDISNGLDGQSHRADEKYNRYEFHVLEIIINWKEKHYL